MPEVARATRFLVLGPLDAVGNGEPSALGGPKQRAVLGMLISRVGQAVSNDSLVDGIWGEDPPSEVQTSLRSYVSNLRTGTGADIERSGGGYILNADPAAVDAFEFQRLTDEGTKSLSVDPDGASEKLREGLGLWRGKAYADLLGVGRPPVRDPTPRGASPLRRRSTHRCRPGSGPAPGARR
jgi:DNA-binding SARP family transcriptional activator